jgi:hypothetical protein
MSKCQKCQKLGNGLLLYESIKIWYLILYKEDCIVDTVLAYYTRVSVAHVENGEKNRLLND